MNCTRCGGPVTAAASAFHAVCEYCGGTVSLQRRQTEEGVVFLAGDSPGDCVNCRTPLRPATLEGREIAACGDCGGLLMRRDLFAGVVEERRSNWTGGDAPPAPIEPAELKVRRDCPQCAAVMETYAFAGPGNVVIDACGGCGVIWVDGGELTRIERAPGRRNTAPARELTFDARADADRACRPAAYETSYGAFAFGDTEAFALGGLLGAFLD